MAELGFCHRWMRRKNAAFVTLVVGNEHHAAVWSVIRHFLSIFGRSSSQGKLDLSRQNTRTFKNSSFMTGAHGGGWTSISDEWGNQGWVELMSLAENQKEF
ncbi:hypothetical protein PIB30_076904 [Stylosanthes scabra]|uniref:Uncharacterized protein n=1 Tax=Stylosanthes scabra TaxID=79078 RepID=A0ABU6YN01_9FABA|nr:hypothetical protein [Stylosanthes scabra]